MPKRSKPSVLITRPQLQGQQLQVLLQSSGWGVIYYPTVEIQATTGYNPSELHKEYAQVQAVIFTSYHAVENFSNFFSKLWKIQQPALFAIGETTQQALQHAGFVKAIFPKQQQNSENLSELIVTHLGSDVHDAIIWIITGEGGRMVLSEDLLQAGALPRVIPCYRRVCPTTPISAIQYQTWESQDWQYIVATSQEVLTNLVQLLPPVAIPAIFEKKLVVFSDRIRVHAVELGFKSIRVTATASDASILAVLETWR